MFRALGRSVSGWTLPAATDAARPPRGRPGECDAPDDRARRRAGRGRPALPRDGPRRHRAVQRGLVRPVPEDVRPRAPDGRRGAGQGRLRRADGRLRPRVPGRGAGPQAGGAAESHYLLRPVLGFFRAYSPDRLLEELQAEQRRDRRRQLLNLLEAHGAPARAAAWDRLQSDPEGRVAGVYFLRNLVLPAPGDTASRRHAVADRGGGRRAGAAHRARAAALPGQGSAPVPGGDPPPVGGVAPRGAVRAVEEALLRADRVGRGSQGAADPPRPGGGGARAPRHPARVGRDRGARARPAGVVRRPPLEAGRALEPGPVAGADRRRGARGGRSRRTCPAGCSGASCRAARPR